MSISSLQLERQLLESEAGRAVYDALVQANVDLRTVSSELVQDLLCTEHRHRRFLYGSQTMSESCRLFVG